MQVEALEVLGLVGVTIVVTSGSIFDGLRQWCLGFEHPLNIFRWFGELISCPVCAGMWVGFGWAMFDGQGWLVALVAGGLISFMAMVTDMALGLLHLVQHKASGHERSDVIRQLLEARAVKKAELATAKHKQLTGEDIDENEAHALIDEADEIADRSAA